MFTAARVLSSGEKVRKSTRAWISRKEARRAITPGGNGSPAASVRAGSDVFGADSQGAVSPSSNRDNARRKKENRADMSRSPGGASPFLPDRFLPHGICPLGRGQGERDTRCKLLNEWSPKN